MYEVKNNNIQNTFDKNPIKNPLKFLNIIVHSVEFY